MGMFVNTNVSAINAYQNLEANQAAESKAITRLSSGFRINSAADDAAGLVISNNLTSQVNGLQQASTNAQNGISLVQTAEGALNETTSILQRLRTLALEGSNGTTDSAGLSAIKAEVTSSVADIDQIASSTQYGSLTLLGAGAGASTFTFQVGAYGTTSDQVAVSISGANSVALGLNTGLTFGSNSDAAAAVSLIDSAISTVSALAGQLGAYQNQLQHVVNNLGVGVQNLSAAESTIKDTDMASTYSEFTKEQILVQTSTSMLAQANAMPQSVLKLIQ